ncbi:hypothetical protein WISP_100017 [Willisornis vidua]|uniref:Uncharacterized protein n=1 Tax=Willisornis vidua TaxID=1566151 RepID=A0ABQ9CYS5_9PASS|nr:hypothetical protein WISP_100017 [Willisornis vidua]
MSGSRHQQVSILAITQVGNGQKQFPKHLEIVSKTPAAMVVPLGLRFRKCSSHITKVIECKARKRENEEPPAEGEDQVQDHLRNLKVHKPMGPDEMYPWVRRELANEEVKSLSIILEKSWQSSEVLTD